MNEVSLYYSYAMDKKKEYDAVMRCARNYLGLNAIDLHIIHNSYGKPDFDCCMHFNISHSKDLWVCAIYKDEIGVDTEFIRSRDYAKVAEYALQSSPQNTIDFYRDWCKKESYLKYKGVGLSEIGKPVDELLTYTYVELDENYITCICTEKEIEVKKIEL